MDKISGLPADILTIILSLLTMKEAARTSILSRHWKYFWRRAVASSLSLNLDVLAMKSSDFRRRELCDCLASKPNELLETERSLTQGDPSMLLETKSSKFIGSVHQILHLDHSSVKDSFRLRFYLENDAHYIDPWIDMAIAQMKDFAHHIDQWINMALARRRQNLDIDLSHFVIEREIYCIGDLYQSFPCLSSAKCLNLTDCFVRSFESSGFSFLLDLQLQKVLIGKDTIDSVLSNCPNLEKFCLSMCMGLLKLKISGMSLKLKDLTIHMCKGLKEIEINADNLTRLNYSGLGVKFTSMNVPQLSDVIFRTEISNNHGALSYAYGKLSSDFPNMESLMLSVETMEEKKIPRQLTLFTKLKLLVLLVQMSCEETLWGFIPLLQASPYLRKLELHMSVYSHLESKAPTEKPLDAPLPHLEEIILSGYTGRSRDIEFARYLLDNATSLKKLTICYHHFFYRHITGTLDGGSKRLLKELATNAREHRWPKGGACVQLEDLCPDVQLLFA